MVAAISAAYAMLLQEDKIPNEKKHPLSSVNSSAIDSLPVEVLVKWGAENRQTNNLKKKTNANFRYYS